jgi:hypothetical protein
MLCHVDRHGVASKDYLGGARAGPRSPDKASRLARSIDDDSVAYASCQLFPTRFVALDSLFIQPGNPCLRRSIFRNLQKEAERPITIEDIRNVIEHLIDEGEKAMDRLSAMISSSRKPEFALLLEQRRDRRKRSLMPGYSTYGGNDWQPRRLENRIIFARERDKRDVASLTAALESVVKA